jgi:hypothetical protein
MAPIPPAFLFQPCHAANVLPELRKLVPAYTLWWWEFAADSDIIAKS